MPRVPTQRVAGTQRSDGRQEPTVQLQQKLRRVACVEPEECKRLVWRTRRQQLRHSRLKVQLTDFSKCLIQNGQKHYLQ